MKKIILLIFIIILILPIFIIKKESTNKEIELNNNVIESNKPEVPIEEKIGQMLIIGYNKKENIRNEIYDDIKNNRVSGIIFYKRHIKSLNQIKSNIDALNELPKKHPLFLMIDQEGGLVSRIADDNGFKTYPSADDISKKYTPSEAYKIYNDMAKDLSEAGFNFNLAPCVDIQTNSKSVIGKKLRSYGSDAETVTKYSYEFIKAHNNNKVLTSLKHFPGIGNAVEDTHTTLPNISNSWSKAELEPFINIFNEFPDEPTMIGHVVNNNIDPDKISSISEKTIELLKSLNHTGIVITDAIDMDAVNTYTIDDIIIEAINAGVNLFIFPNHIYDIDDPKKCMNPKLFQSIILKGIEEDKIDIDKINSSYLKIIKLKKKL